MNKLSCRKGEILTGKIPKYWEEYLSHCNFVQYKLHSGWSSIETGTPRWQWFCHTDVTWRGILSKRISFLAEHLVKSLRPSFRLYVRKDSRTAGVENLSHATKETTHILLAPNIHYPLHEKSQWIVAPAWSPFVHSHILFI